VYRLSIDFGKYLEGATMPKVNNKGLPEYTKADYRTLFTLLCPPEIYAKLLSRVIKSAADGDVRAFQWLHEQLMKYAPSGTPMSGTLPALTVLDTRRILDDLEGEINGYFVTSEPDSDGLPEHERQALEAAANKLKAKS